MRISVVLLPLQERGLPPPSPSSCSQPIRPCRSSLQIQLLHHRRLRPLPRGQFIALRLRALCCAALHRISRPIAQQSCAHAGSSLLVTRDVCNRYSDDSADDEAPPGRPIQMTPGFKSKQCENFI